MDIGCRDSVNGLKGRSLCDRREVFWVIHFMILDSKNRIFREKCKHLPIKASNNLAKKLLMLWPEI
jgi:hypothetical protein